MRKLINNYSFENGTRAILLPTSYQIGVHNIRLIVNETQKFVICSSMQKDLVSVSNNVITYSSSLPVLATGDELTIEIDMGTDLNAKSNDFILNNRLMGVSGEPFAVELGSYLDNQISSIINNSVSELASAILPGVKGILRAFFNGTNITKLELSTNITAVGLFMDSYLNCPLLTEISVPNYVAGGDWQYMGRDAFSGCPSLIKFTCRPETLRANDSSSCLINTASQLRTVILSADAANDINLKAQAFLTPATVKHILTRCANANMNGKTISFYSNGLTVQDDEEGSIQDLYDEVVNTYGATIANLTITPYSA